MRSHTDEPASQVFSFENSVAWYNGCMGYIFAIISAFAIAASSLVAKKVLHKEHSLGFALTVHIAGFALLVPFIGRVDFSVSGAILAWTYLASWLGAIGFLMITKAMRHLEVSVVVPLMNLSVVLLVFLSYFFLGELMSVMKLAGISLIVIGGYLLDANHGGIDLIYPFRQFKKSKHFHFLALGITFYAFSSVVDKVVLLQTTPVTYLFFVYMFLTCNFLLLVLVLQPPGGIRRIIREAQGAQWLMLAFVVTRLVSNFFYAAAVTAIFLAVAVAIKRTSALITVLFSGALFHEKHIYWKLSVSSVMIAGVVLAVFG